MAILNIKFPQTLKSYYSEDEIKQIGKKLEMILDKYYDEISQASRLCNIPEEVIMALIFIESGGQIPKKDGPVAYGLMQVSPGMASDGIFMEYKQGRLSNEEKSILKKGLGSRLDCILKMKSRGQKLACNQLTGIGVTPKDLANPEFNILVGSIVLGQLIDQETENNRVRFDKVIIRYNAGFSYKPKGATIEETIKYAFEKGGKETVAYITKFLGKNGLMDILINKMRT